MIKMIICLRICWDNYINDKIYIIKENERGTVTQVGGEIILGDASFNRIVKKKCKLNSYFVSLFVTTLKISENYRFSVTKYLIKTLPVGKKSSFVRLKIVMYSGKHILDYKWSDILNHLCYEKRELHTAMAWLSTLGGAFSALGELSTHHALMAGRISAQQFKIALRLGDPPTVARCRLFYALSLIQCGKLKRARDLIKYMYRIAITQHVNDKRLQRMCYGIWNKLQYEWHKKYKCFKS